MENQTSPIPTLESGTEGLTPYAHGSHIVLTLPIGIFGFAVLDIFLSVFRFLCQKTSVFRFWCSMRFADFSFFSIWFSVFIKIVAVFRFWYPMWFLVFPIFFGYLDLFGYTVLYAVFGCGRFCLRFWTNFSSVLRFLVYPNAPLFKIARRL